MIGGASVTAPVTQELSANHIVRMIGRDFAGQIIQLKTTQSGSGTFIIQEIQQLLANQRELLLIETAALDESLAASE